MKFTGAVEYDVEMWEQTFRDLSRLMAGMLRPLEEYVAMDIREGVLRAEVYRAIDAIRWSKPVPEETWRRLDELNGGAS